MKEKNEEKKNEDRFEIEENHLCARMPTREHA